MSRTDEQPPAPRRPADRRVPPHDLQAEESLLGAMMLEVEAIASAAGIVRAADFYKPAHAHIYDAVHALYAGGQPVDPVTVADELRRAGLIDVVGGHQALVQIMASTPATTNAVGYARIVEEHALLRRLIGVAGEIAELGYAMPDDVTKALDRAESLVYEVNQRRVTDTTMKIEELLGQNLDRLEQLYGQGDAITGVPTGYNDLDDLLSGLQPSTLVVVGARPAMGKALALDTRLPTPSGWTTMGDVKIGDRVFDDQGGACSVSYVSPIQYDRRCYELTFDDGSTIVADADHQWFAYDLPAWRSRRDRHDRQFAQPLSRSQGNQNLARDQSARMRRPRVVTTEQMVEEGIRCADRPNWYVLLAGPLDLPDADLPVDPYVLGCWLGDGSSTTSELTIGEQDFAHFQAQFNAAGYPFERRHDPQCATVPMAGSGAWPSYSGSYRILTRELQSMGLLRGAAKHIPAVYLRASTKQRLALLQGLLDTDDCVTNRNGTVEVCLANRRLLEQTHELVTSLGHKPGVLRKKETSLRGGRLATAWRFCWTPLDPVFRLPRKAERLAAEMSDRAFGRMTRRTVVQIRPVESVPVRCITVNSPSHLYLAGDSMVPTHNTSFALGMATHAALYANYPVLVFSLEMGNLELSQRMLCGEARIDSARVRTGRLTEDDWNRISQAIGRLAAAPIWIDDNPNVTVMEIRAKARRLRSQVGNLGMVVVDYLQLMTGRGSAENRQVEVAEMSRGLKILARELECPVIALSQLSRQLEMRADKRPMLADLRESGCLVWETRVLRADTGTEVPIGELAASGERDIPVWSLDTDLRMVPATMTHAFQTGVKEVFEMTLASGRRVTASANHPFLTVDGWLRLDELAPGSRIAVPRLVPQPKETQVWPEHEVVLLARRSHEKFVPPPVFALSDEQIALFLGHLWATDGCVGWWGQGRIYYASTSRRLVDDVRHLLLRLGIRSTLRTVNGSPAHPGYQLHIEGRDARMAFLDQIEVPGQRSTGAADVRQRLEGVISSPNVDTVPIEVWDRVRRLMSEKGVTTRRLAAELGTQYSGSTLYQHAPSRSRLAKVAEVVDDEVVSGLATSDVFWDRVTSIECRGTRPVYDATVESTHNFVANGVVLENSIEQDADVVMFIYRDDVYHSDSPDRGQAEVIVAKHRNGPTGVCRLAFLSQFTRFANMARVD